MKVGTGFITHTNTTMLPTLVAVAIVAACGYFIYWHYVVKRRQWLPRMSTKPVFITGCDSGFGRALALRLDRKGVPVFAGCYTSKGVDSLVGEGSFRLRAVQVDVSKDDSIQAAYTWVRKQLTEGKYKGVFYIHCRYISI